MRSKSWILLVIALGCGAVASVGISQVVMEQRNHATGEEGVEILVAAKDMDAGAKISSDSVKLERWPRNLLPDGYITTLKEVDGKYSGQRFYPSEPILQKKLMNTVNSLDITIPKGSQIFDLAVDEKTGGAGYVKPGHRVNVYGFFEKSGKIAETKSVLVMENVVVFAVDGNAIRDPNEKNGKASRTIQLLIKSSQYDALFAASNLSKQMRVSLRPPGDEVNDLETDNGEKFLKWLQTTETPNDTSIRNTTQPVEIATPVEAKAQSLAPPAAPERHMVVITSSGLTKYRLATDKGLPEVVDDSKASSPNVSSPSRAAPAGGVPSGMTWNSSTNQWSPGGFTATYPDADVKTEMPGTNDPANGSEKGQR